jgi:hypothetical protein
MTDELHRREPGLGHERSRIQALQALLAGGHREAPMIWTAGSVVRTGWERVGGPRCDRLGSGAT